ncbi:probable sodium-coupled neutral amino acid transporter 6 [Gadus macrocephalus]|uniref:probable sodium-coupled neutral amino acid transporter 6 n=1 Tax=Gadus macrocephalus TaxID=80720 RepID=UPI0028CB5851|nr:probable sodium-coupled neutral amino acid transporter 6 [Gadus macrocephalus]
MSINSNESGDLPNYGTTPNIGDDEATPLLGNASEAPRVKGTPFAACVFNLMSAIMGSGILGLAFAMANTGIVGFCILLLLVTGLAGFSIHLLLQLCDQTGINSYEDLGEKALKKPGKILVGLSILAQNIGAMTSYMFILKSELPATISSFLSPGSTMGAWYEDGRILLILVTVFVVLPLALLTRIGWLSYTSSISFFFMLYFMVVVIVKKFTIPCPLHQNGTMGNDRFQISNSSASECTPKAFVISRKSAYALPIMAFSFLCHTAVLPIYCELDRPTKKRMQQVTNTGLCLSCMIYLLSALFGYLTFYSHVDSELLLNYDTSAPRDPMVMIVRLTIQGTVLFTVPLLHFPARKSLITLLFDGRPFSWLRHVSVTVGILVVALMATILLPDFRSIFGVVGSTTSTCLLFVYPGIFFLKLSKRPLRSAESVGAVILLVSGLFVGTTSLCMIIVTWVQGS